jgi:hypothetical protein
MCQIGVTCRPTDCYFRLAYWSSTKRTTSSSSSSHRNVTCSRHDIAEKCSFGIKEQSLTQMFLYNYKYFAAILCYGAVVIHL